MWIPDFTMGGENKQILLSVLLRWKCHKWLWKKDVQISSYANKYFTINTHQTFSNNSFHNTQKTCQTGGPWRPNTSCILLRALTQVSTYTTWWQKRDVCRKKTRRIQTEQNLSSVKEGENTQPIQSQHCCNVVLGRLCDGRMAPPRHIHTPSPYCSQ